MVASSIRFGSFCSSPTSAWFRTLSVVRRPQTGSSHTQCTLVEAQQTGELASQPGLCEHDAIPILVSRLTDFGVRAHRIYKTREDAKGVTLSFFPPTFPLRTRVRPFHECSQLPVFGIIFSSQPFRHPV